ncbi:hypothetical protein C8F04DRAFT_1189215 [Mycena alexandri]|uniref:Uncharacterized protein n=1 Tax=Mycena alexandri TaxID=1745969 RepID=A0AAD6X0J1_9AGAR|nr:hypothetical protein C8F04DRAFT_1189215 [Mycena alexandri]
MRRETAGILTSSATSASGPSNPAGGAAEGGAGKWDVLSERLRVVAAANNVQKQPKMSPTTFSTLTARKVAVVGRHHQGVGEMEKERSTDNDGDGDADLGRDLADMRGGGLPSLRGTGTCHRRGSATIRPWGGAKEHVRVLGVVHVWRGWPRLHLQIRCSRGERQRTDRGTPRLEGVYLPRPRLLAVPTVLASMLPHRQRTPTRLKANSPRPRRRWRVAASALREKKCPMERQGAGLGLGGLGVLLDLTMLDGVAGNLDAVFCEAVRGSVIIGEGTRRAGTPARQSVTSRDGIAISVFDDTDDHRPSFGRRRALDPLARVAALAEFPNSYADDGYGAIYFIAVVDDHTLGNFHSGHIFTAEFLARVRVKVGEAGHLTSRQRGYRHCDVGQTHFWLFAFYPNKRKAAEKMCHYSFLADAPRAFLECSCGTTHTEYWWLKDLRSFTEVEERARPSTSGVFLGREMMRIDSAYMNYAREITLDFEMKEADICGPGSTGVGVIYVAQAHKCLCFSAGEKWR